MQGSARSHSYQKPKSAAKTLGRILGYMMHKKWILAFAALFVLISAATGIAGTYLIKPLINQGIVPLIGKSPKGSDFRLFVQIILIMSANYLFGSASSYIYSRLMIQVSNETLNAIRKDLFNRMQDLPIKYFDAHTHGELMSRYTSDVDTLRDTISSGVSQLMMSSITIIGTFAVMLMLSPILTVVTVVMLIIMSAVTKKIASKSADYFKKQQKAIGETNGYIEEMIEGQKVVKVFSHEEDAKIEFSALNEELRRVATSANTYASVMMPIMINISYVSYAFTAAIGAVMIITGRLDIGSIASFLQYTRSFSQPITQISQQFNAILAALAGAERVFEIIDQKPEVDNGSVTLVNVTENPDGTLDECECRTGLWAWKRPSTDGEAEYIRLRGDVRFEHVDFGYDENKMVLRDISFSAEPGQKIAFVGSTGAGKTTIINLVNRFYDVSAGKIVYDGIDIKEIRKEDLRRSLAMVLQDIHLFTATVRENIRYGKLDATDDEVVEAAKLVNAHGFIMNLPQGYETLLVSDGSNLSQGQRQLISIARAAVANPPVLVLDEATSSIDTRTESIIKRGMDKLMDGRTVFIIAHRLSTVQSADSILVLENGEVIERGTHEELISKEGKYHQLYTGKRELA